MTELRYFPGTEQTIEILLDAGATGGTLALLRFRMPPGAAAPLHRHTRESETLAVVDGELSVEVDGTSRRLAKGEAIHLPQGSLHAFSSDGGATIDVIATPAGLEEFFRAVCPLDPDAPPVPEDEARAALERAGLDFSGR